MLQEVINKRLYLLQRRMDLEYLKDTKTHLGTLACLMIIIFHFITLGIWLRTAECMTGLIIKDIIQT